MSLAVNVLSRNPNEDRVIPRFSRYLREGLGWTLTARPVSGVEVFYLSGYFEHGLIRQTPGAAKKPVAAYFTHLEENNAAKARLFWEVAGQVDLRVVTAGMYGEMLRSYGPTVQILPPVERERFVIPASKGKVGSRPLVAGFSGFTYREGRKGEKLAGELVRGGGTGVPYYKRGVEWMASGRGWPVRTRMYGWGEMPGFYQGLDVYVCTALVEGVPMPVLEALSCGVSVVIPRGVGLLDEVGEGVGVHRYERGEGDDLVRAFREACEVRGEVEPRALRWLTEPYTVEGWCEGHRAAFEELFGGEAVFDAKTQRRKEGMRGRGEEEMFKSLMGSDEEVLGEVRKGWGEVDSVLAWTRKKIPYLKRQIAPFQGAVLAYFAHFYDRPDARFLEIGTAIGYSACLMATAAPHAHITTLNPKEGEYEVAVKNLRIRANVEVVKRTSQEFLKKQEGTYDLIFVDGDHAYNMVLHDAQFFNWLNPGGLILFHDYSPEGSARPSEGCFRALNDLAEARRPFDVLVVGTGQVGMAGWVRREGETWD